MCAVQKEVKTGQAVAAERQVERAEVKTEGDSEDLMKDLLGGDDDDEVEFSGMSHDVSPPLSLTHSHYSLRSTALSDTRTTPSLPCERLSFQPTAGVCP